jgi:hypothetical protein
LYVPTQGRGRIDNPDDYAVLYVADAAPGAVAEVFNFGDYRQKWTNAMLRSRRGAYMSVATYALKDPNVLCDLDEASRLVQLELRPSQVVTYNYAVTKTWAKHVYDSKQFIGVRWWSYHDARWGSLGIWKKNELKCTAIERLTLDHPAVVEAASILSIEISSHE